MQKKKFSVFFVVIKQEFHLQIVIHDYLKVILTLGHSLIYVWGEDID